MKNFLINIYKLINTLNILLIVILKKNFNSHPVLFLNGARSGSLGGPKVKVHRLTGLFNISRYNPNIFYCLSNCIYTYNFYIKKYIKFKMPIIYNQNGIFHKVWFKGNVLNKNKEMKFYLQNSDYVFYQSKFCKQCCDDVIYKRTKDFKVLYNAVDTNFFIPAKHVSLPHIPIIKIGIYNNSNIWRLVCTIKALKKINDINGNIYKLSIVGPIEENAKNKIIKLINSYSMNEQISILGELEQDKIVNIMQRHKIFLSTKIYDPCSNTIIESMSCGLPVIYHNSGGNYELVENAGWGFGNKTKSIKKIKIYEEDIFYVLKIITQEDIHKKSKLARNRAEKYFNILKWEYEHKKIFDYYIKKNKKYI